VLPPQELAQCSAMGKTHKKQRAETASANKSAAAKARWASEAAAAGLEALGAGAVEVCTTWRFKRLRSRLTPHPTQAASEGAPDERLSLKQLRPKDGGGALVRGFSGAVVR